VRSFLLLSALLGLMTACGVPEETALVQPQPRPSVKGPNRSIPKDQEDPLLAYVRLKAAWQKNPTEELSKDLEEILRTLAHRAEKEKQFFHAKNYWTELLDVDPFDDEARDRLTALAEEEDSDENSEEAPASSGVTLSQEGSVGGSSHFFIHLKGNAPFQNVQTVSYMFEQAHIDVGSRLGLYPDEPLGVYLYTDKEFENVTGMPPWVKGIYDGSIHLPVANMRENDPLIKQVIYHEYTHALIYQLTENHCPLWLNEGLAQLMEPEERPVDLKALSELGKRGQLPDLASRNFLSQGPQTAARLYEFAFAVTRYLVQNEGYWPLDNYFKSLKQGKDPDTAFRDAYLFPLDDLQKRFLDNIQ